MTEHRLHAPHLIPAPPAPSKKECQFCGNNTVTAGYCSSCNTHFPNVKSTDSLQHLMQINPKKCGKDRPQKAALQQYILQCDGVDELSPDEADAGELEGLDLPGDQEGFDPDEQADLLPADDDLPW